MSKSTAGKSGALGWLSIFSILLAPAAVFCYQLVGGIWIANTLAATKDPVFVTSVIEFSVVLYVAVQLLNAILYKAIPLYQRLYFPHAIAFAHTFMKKGRYVVIAPFVLLYLFADSFKMLG